MYSKIIVPLDGSDLAEQALPYAELVARTLSVPVELVQAYDTLPSNVLGSRSGRVADQLHQTARDRAEASLEPTRQRLEAAGLAVNIATQRGQAAESSCPRPAQTRAPWWSCAPTGAAASPGGSWAA